MNQIHQVISSLCYGSKWFHVLKDLEITVFLCIFRLQVKKIYITTGMFSSDINLAGKFSRKFIHKKSDLKNK